MLEGGLLPIAKAVANYEAILLYSEFLRDWFLPKHQAMSAKTSTMGKVKSHRLYPQITNYQIKTKPIESVTAHRDMNWRFWSFR